MMKHFVLTVLCLIGSLYILSAQQRGFSEDPNLTLNEMKIFFETSSKGASSDIKDILKNFEVFWISADANTQKDFIEAANAIARKRMPAIPNMSSFIQAYQLFVNSPQSSQTTAWKQSIFFIIKSSTKNFAKYFTSYINLFENNIISSNSTITWKTEGEPFTLGFDKEPTINYSNINLFGINVNDSISILNTSGTLYMNQNLFKGKKGKTTWKRANLADDIYAIYDDYDINVSLQVIRIENVLFYDSRYFSAPIKGYLTDRAIANNTSQKTTFPHFFSYDKHLKINNFFKDIDIIGGFELKGNAINISGDTGNVAKIIFKRNQKKTLEITSRNFTIKNNKIATSDSKMAIYFENDSITHPSVNINYNDSSRHFMAARSLNSVGRSAFFDSYHKLDITVEAIHWNLDEETIIFGTILGTTEGIPAIFESQNFYDQTVLGKFQGLNEESTLMPLYRMFKQNNYETLKVSDIVRYYGSIEEDIIPIIIRAANYGFIEYDIISQSVAYRDKLEHYFMAANGKKDYDIIIFESLAQADYAKLSLLTNELKISSVPGLALSDVKIVNFTPDNGELIVNKNRDMVFSGKVISGLYDIYGNNFLFNYEKFQINFEHIDSMIINTEDKTKPKDQYGDYPLRKVNNYIYGINGYVLIDEPNNKSGTKETVKYPYFESQKDGQVFYERSFVHEGILYQGKYPRETFYYTVKPFIIEDMLTNDVNTVRFEGYFKSADIFEELEIPLVIRPEDFSLGFVYNTGSNGLNTYGGKGTFYDTLDLSNQGLRGLGSVVYKNSTTTSQNFLFLPESMIAIADSYKIKEDNNSSVETPHVTSVKSHIEWLPYEDVMNIKSMDDLIYAFNNRVKFKGTLEYRPNGVYGKGLCFLKNAELTSNSLQFKHHELLADTSDLAIKGLDENSIVFQTQGFKSHIDFGTNIGEFESVKDTSEIKFIANQYKTSCSKYEWLMEKGEINLDWSKENKPVNIEALSPKELFAMKGTAGTDMISTAVNQGGLKFKGSHANYNIQNNIINMDGVKFIQVADAAVIPKNGKLSIYPNAIIEQLSESKILADTLNQIYEFYNSSVNILSISKLLGKGYYDFIDENQKVETIKLDSIFVAAYKTRAMANIPIEQDFTLSPHFGYNGKMEITASDSLIFYNGIVDIKHSCDSVYHSTIAVKQPINQYDIIIDLEKGCKDSSDAIIYNEVNSYRKTDDDMTTSTIYTTYFMQNKLIGSNYAPLIEAYGCLCFDKENQCFKITSKEKFKHPELPDAVIELNKRDCIYHACGPANLKLNIPGLNIMAYGRTTSYPIIDSTVFNMTLAIDFPIPEEILKEINFNTSTADYNESMLENDYTLAIRSFMGEDIYKKYTESQNKGMRKNELPKQLQQNFIFSEVPFTWNSNRRAFVANAPLNLAVLNKNIVARTISGTIVLDKSTASRKQAKNKLYIYFEIDNDWYLFFYDGSTMRIGSTNAAFNNSIAKAIDNKKNSYKNGFSFMLLNNDKTNNNRALTEAEKAKANLFKIYRPAPEENEEE